MFISEEFMKTSSPISAKDFEHLLNTIEKIKAPYTDRKVIGAIIKMVYDAALKKEEILNLKIVDIINDIGAIRIGNNTVSLDKFTQYFLTKYISYLKEKGYKTTKKSPLFPQKDGKPYYPRKLHNDIIKFTKKIGLEKIRHAGICNYYENLVCQGTPHVICEKLTSEFARCSLRHTRGILTGKIQRAGKPKQTGALYYLDRTERLVSSSDNINDLIIDAKSLIKEIESDNKLDQNLKETLKNSFLQSFCEQHHIDTSMLDS